MSTTRSRLGLALTFLLGSVLGAAAVGYYVHGAMKMLQQMASDSQARSLANDLRYSIGLVELAQAGETEELTMRLVSRAEGLERSLDRLVICSSADACEAVEEAVRLARLLPRNPGADRPVDAQ